MSAPGFRINIRAARFGCTAVGVTGSLLMGAQPVTAQITPQSLPSQGDVSRERLTLPPVEAPRFDLRIQAPDRSAVPKAIDAIEFEVKQIVVEGATAFSPERVNAFFAPLLNKKIPLEEVRRAAVGLEQLYRQEGYFLTRVFIPPQQVENETLKITVIEGFIDEIAVEGADEGTRNDVKKALAPLRARKPIDLASVERQLLILNDIPGISGTSVLRQGARLGGSDLVVTLDVPENAYQVSVNNVGSRIIGPWAVSGNTNLNRPFHLPGALNLGVSAGGRNFRAVQTASARYSFALGTQGLLVSFGALGAKARPAGSVRQLDIRNNLISLSGRARYPVIRGRAHSFFVEAGLSVNRSDTDILGIRLVEDRTSVGDVGLIYQQNGWLDGSTTVSASVFQGLQIFGALKRSAPRPSVLDFDPQFTRVTYSVQRVQRLPASFSWVIAAQGQLTGSKLLSGELISFGGPSIGRGFDPSAITGDRGAGALVELRYDLAIAKSWAYNAQLYGFFDGARTSSLATSVAPASSQRIRSVGGGVRVYHRYGQIDMQLAYAHRQIGSADERGNPRALISASVQF